MKIIINGKTFEVSKEQLEANPNEVTIDTDVVIRTAEEEVSFSNNIKNEAKQAGLEIAIKEARNKLGLDFQGKTIDNLLKAYETKVLNDAQIEPAEQLKSITQKLTEKEQALQNALGLVNEKEHPLNSFKKETVINQTLDSFLPEKTILPKDDMKLIIRNKLSFDLDDSGKIIALDSFGNVLKNPTTADPRSAKEVLDDFFRTNPNYINAQHGGSGGDDSKPKGGKISLDDFIKSQKESGIAPNSAEFNQKLAEANNNGLIDLG
jgi:hypothetical protein